MSWTLRLFLITLVMASAAPAQDFLTWWAEYRKAVEADDYNTKRTLVTKHRRQIFDYFRSLEVEYCKLKNHEEKESRDFADQTLEALRDLATMHSIENRERYLVQRVKWLGSLDEAQRKAKVEHWDLLGKGWPLYEKARAKRTEETIKEALPLFQEMTGKARIANDHFWMINGYLAQGEMAHMQLHYFDACWLYKKAAEAAQEGGLANHPTIGRYALPSKIHKMVQDGNLQEKLIDINVELEAARKKYEEAASSVGKKDEGHGHVKPAPNKKPGKEGLADDAELPPNPKHEAPGEWEDVKGLKLKSFPKGPGVATAYFRDNAHWWFWTDISLEREEEKGTGFLPGETKLRNDKGKLFLTRPGVKKAERLKVAARAKPLMFTNVDYGGSKQKKLWHTMMTQPNTYVFNGFKMRSGTGTIVRVKGATGAVGKVLGQTITIYDSDASGTFDSWGRDTVILGRGRKAQAFPLSTEILLDGKLYHFRVSADGSTIGVKPYVGVLAPLKFEWEGDLKPSYVIVGRQAAGENDEQHTFINLMDLKDKFAWVPAGRYFLTEGYIIKGKGDRSKSMEIAPPNPAKTFTVAVGQKNVWQMGGAGEGFRFEAKPEIDADGQEYVTLPSRSITVKGAWGEIYRRSMFGAPTPKVWIRKGKDGPIWCSGKELKPPGQSDLSDNWDNMFSHRPWKHPRGSSGLYSMKLEGKVEGLGMVKMDWTQFE